MMTTEKFSLLSEIESPADLRKLSDAQLRVVADELREYLIDTVSRTGGHLAAGLGTVELTVALHALFNTPDDRLVWDIGHQAYPHKILTGRREQMHTLRRKDGLNGFLKRDESEFDTFGAGHSSTSISAALGMAVAAARQGGGRKAIAVIGDGALTAGQAFEALNNAGPESDADLLVVLNDNDMSISPNLGGLRNHLTRILSSHTYSKVRETGKQALTPLPFVRELASRWEEHMKGMVMPGTLFEEFGFNYLGPVDGHDMPVLLQTLRNVRDLKGRQFLHVITQKGKGYHPAENNPCKFHGVTPFNRDTGELRPSTAKSFTQTFGDWLCDRAEKDDRLMGVTPAMREGSGMVRFSERFPKQYFDVGIAEQHALTFAAGLACEGMKPVVAIYSTFLQRAYDQLIHDVAIQNLDVTFAIDRAGLVGPDGATHAGSFDLSFLRCVPNMVIMAPSNQGECAQMLSTAYDFPGPAAVRYPKGGVAFEPKTNADSTLEIGTGVIVRRGQRVAILAFGTLLEEAEKAAVMLDATVVNMRFIKPLDQDMIREMAEEHEYIVTIEDNAIAGGAGSGVGEALASMGLAVRLLHLGVPDKFVAHATRDEQIIECGLDADGIVASMKARFSDFTESKTQPTDSPIV